MSRGNDQVSEEALMQDFCEKVALKLQPIFVALGAHDIKLGRVFMHDWKPSDMSVLLTHNKAVPNRKYINRVRFNGLYYDPNSERVDGTSRVSHGSPRPVPNGTKTIINPYDDRVFPVDSVAYR